MGRLRGDLVIRTESFADRVIKVCFILDRQRVLRRIADQLSRSGTSVGANVCEADEAMSRADFTKCLAIASKELSETLYWLRMVGRHSWIPAKRLTALLEEGVEIRKVIGAVIVRTIENNPKPATRRSRSAV